MTTSIPLVRFYSLMSFLIPPIRQQTINTGQLKLISPTAQALWKNWCPPCGYTNPYLYLQDGQKYIKTQITFYLSILNFYKTLLEFFLSPTARGALFEKTAPLNPPQKLFICGKCVAICQETLCPLIACPLPSSAFMETIHRLKRRTPSLHCKCSPTQWGFSKRFLAAEVS